ncbi:kinase-like domain-containing protein [Circinella umbellata]|nr:kinase-like domain-containing protein [Circinella umbellata]
MIITQESEQEANTNTVMTTIINTCQCNLCSGKAFDSLRLASPDGDLNMNSNGSLLSFSSSSSTVSFQSFGSAGIRELDMVKRVRKGMNKPLANGSNNMSTLQSIGDYYFLNALHQGSNAQIKLAEHRITHEKVAVKITPRANKYAFLDISSDVEDKDENKNRETSALERLRDEHAYREAQIILLLRHPCIPQVHDFITTADHYYLVMEHINGVPLLFKVIQQGYLSEKYARKYAIQVWQILDYLHGHAIVHLDVRIDNLLLEQNEDRVKLLDFSTASPYINQKGDVLYKRHHLCRSIHYTAPELLDPMSETFEGPPVDVWNFGVLIYIMVTGEMPFEGYSPEQVSRRIRPNEDDKEYHVQYPDRLSPECRHLIQSMLATNPRQRISLAQVAQHPWFRSTFPTSDIIQREKPLKPPLDPLVIQSMARAFRTVGSPQRIAKKLTAIIQSKDTLSNHPQHPFVLLYLLYQDRVAFLDQFLVENDNISSFGEHEEEEEEEEEENTEHESYRINQDNHSIVSSINFPNIDSAIGLQLVFDTSTQEQQPRHEDQSSPSINQYRNQHYHHNHHHHHHRKSRLLRRIKNWYKYKIVRCKK